MPFNFSSDIENAPYETNLAQYLSEAKLQAIGTTLKESAEQDCKSRQQWMDQNKEWLRLASQVMETKSFPWPNASNVKYPLLTTAAMQFHARALPNLIPDDRPVKTKINGHRRMDQSKVARGERVSEYMSFQILEEQTEWLDEMDRMLFVLPMVGICYKKTYFSSKYRRNKSELILPNEMYINYYAKNFEGAQKTHLIPIDSNTMVGLQRQGFYLDVELPPPQMPEHDPNDKKAVDMATPSPDAHDFPYIIYEMETWLDLDEDGYKEPYLVTLESDSGIVLRILARWKAGDISYNDKNEIAEIADFTQVTPYIFLPDPASATSGLGLGSLLGPTNEAVNTLINQLIDAGTLSNLQCGFLSKGIGLRGGATRFRPGEWKIVNSSADDLRKNVYPIPAQQPSQVLFSLLGMLINSGEILGSITDIMVGENPGQNQKATTSMIVQEQGMAVYSSIYKRIYRGLAKEFRKFYELNFEFLSPEKYNIYFDGEDEVYDPKLDFNPIDMDIMPAADPSTVSDSQKVAKSMAPLQLVQLGTVNPAVITRKILEAQGQTDIEELMNVPTPPPSIEDRDMRLKEQLEPARLKLEALKTQVEAIEKTTKAELNRAQGNKALVEAVVKAQEQQLKEAQAMAAAIMKSIEVSLAVDKGIESGRKEES